MPYDNHQISEIESDLISIAVNYTRKKFNQRSKGCYNNIYKILTKDTEKDTESRKRPDVQGLPDHYCKNAQHKAMYKLEATLIKTVMAI